MKIINEKTLASKTWTFPRGEVRSKSIIDTPDVTVSVSVIAPNSKLPDEPHTHERHEMLYVSEGSVQVFVDQETKTASAGDFILPGLGKPLCYSHFLKFFHFCGHISHIGGATENNCISPIQVIKPFNGFICG